MTGFFDNYLRRNITPSSNNEATNTEGYNTDVTESIILLTSTINKIIKAINYDYNYNDTVLRLINSKAPILHTHMLATHETNGFMSSEDKITLDNVLAKSNTFTIKIFEFYDESQEWVVVHNQNTSDFIVQIYDDKNNIIYTTIEITDNNKFLIKFTTPVKGKAKVLFYLK
jgi:predicted glutamine amidotransferase